MGNGGKPAVLNVAGSYKKSIDLTYDDIIVLYNEYIDKHGAAPTGADCLSKNNLPQMRIINKILHDANVTYNDFLNSLGKYSHVRTESNDYFKFVNRFKDVARMTGRVPRLADLQNNTYGLPSASWFVKHCPDKYVASYDAFVEWCGYESNKLKKWSKDEVASALRALEEKLNRPLSRADINASTVGFSMIVINRLYGSLSKAKGEIGLNPEVNRPVGRGPWFYVNALKEVIEDFIKQTGRRNITWAEIESGKYAGYNVGHHSYRKAFKDINIDIDAFMKGLGCETTSGVFSRRSVMDDGEIIWSSLEYEFSTYLRSLGMQYKKDYSRDVRYSEYTHDETRCNCDYVLCIGGDRLFIEIAGMLYRPKSGDFSTHTYPDDVCNNYRDRLAYKRDMLDGVCANYLLLFSNDIKNGKYKSMFNEKYAELKRVAA